VQKCNLAVFDVAFHRRLIGRVEFEIGCPLSRPSGQQQDAFAVALHQHQLQGDHAGTPALRIPKPTKPLAPVSDKLSHDDPLSLIGQAQDRGLRAILPQALSIGNRLAL